MPDQEKQPEPCACDATKVISSLEDFRAQIEETFQALGSIVETAIEEAEPEKIGQEWSDLPVPETETFADAPKPKPPDQVIEAINAQDRPAKARGLTSVSVVQANLVAIADQVLPADPLRRSFAVSYHPGVIVLVPYVVDPMNTRQAGFLASALAATIFTEEEWGEWIQQAWYHAWPNGGNTYDICVERYVQ